MYINQTFKRDKISVRQITYIHLHILIYTNKKLCAIVLFFVFVYLTHKKNYNG